MPKTDKLFLIGFILLVGVGLGYFWHYKAVENNRVMAEERLMQLEDEFDQAAEKRREFLIFNGRFKVWPLKSDKKVKQFSYAGAGDIHNEGK